MTASAAGKGRLDQTPLRVVLYEGDGAAPLGDEQRAAALDALLDAGHPVTRTAAGSRTAVAPVDDAEHLVLGAFDPDAGWTRDDPERRLAFADIGGRSVEDVTSLVSERMEATGARKPREWKPWFPVIDYERCTNCMQCLSFCLFDVYGVDDAQKIQVQNQDNCKTDCPACSRVCPEAAILFPKYKASPINGAPVKEEDLQRESMKVDISSLLGGDIYAALKDRSKSARERFSTERDESKALIERRKCLKALQKDLDIPDEVLMTLPSAGDIEERARRAREKAEKRRARSRTVADQQRPPSADDWGI